MKPPLILVTNDDGIDSPGLAAAAAALDPLGELLIVAPSAQQTSMARSRSQQGSADGRLFKTEVSFGAQSWPAIAANASPALCVNHALLELAASPVALVVSGINYGENIGSCVTVSGTIGATLEAADYGIPGIAISLELANTQYFSHDADIDFSAAIHFLRYFAGETLAQKLPADVDILKIEVPAAASTETDWVVTRQDRLRYYDATIQRNGDLFDSTGIALPQPAKGQFTAEDTDAFALAHGLVSVTPLSLDLTSRVNLRTLADMLDAAESRGENEQ